MKCLLFLLPALVYGGSVDGTLTCSVLEGTGQVDNQPLSKGLVFKPAQKVKTDAKSTANIFLSNGSKLILNPDSVVHFKVLKQEDGSQQAVPEDGKTVKETGASITEIEVEQGKVIGDVKKLYSGSMFTLKTPVGVVSIKGTVFSVAYTKSDDGKEVFSVGCLVGKVQVQMADPKAAPVSVPAGQQLSIAGGNGAPAQVQLAPLPPAEMKQMAVARPEAANQPPPKPVVETPEDKVMRQIGEVLNSQQVNPSPTGG